MEISRVVLLTNARLAGEQLTYKSLMPYFDSVIDEVNAMLHSCFKVFSEISTTGVGETAVYEEFPDQYIRTVVCVGAAYKWYLDDEEGIDTAQAMGQEYKNNMFIMLRDYGPLVPCEKKRNDHGGFLETAMRPIETAINPSFKSCPIKAEPRDTIEKVWIEDKSDGQHLIYSATSLEKGTRTVDAGRVFIPVVGPKGDSVASLKLVDTDDGQLLMYRLTSQEQGSEWLVAGKIKMPGQKVIKEVSGVPENGDFKDQIGYSIEEVEVKQQSTKDIINGLLESLGYYISEEEVKEEEEP